jgi:hypothetical protein
MAFDARGYQPSRRIQDGRWLVAGNLHTENGSGGDPCRRRGTFATVSVFEDTAP